MFFTDPDLELLLERLTLEDPLRLELELLDTDPEDLLLDDPLDRTFPELPLLLLFDEPDLTLTLGSLLVVLRFDTPDDRVVVLTLVEELLVRDTLLLLLLFDSEEPDELLFTLVRLDLVSYFCVKPLLLAP